MQELSGVKDVCNVGSIASRWGPADCNEEGFLVVREAEVARELHDTGRNHRVTFRISGSGRGGGEACSGASDC